MVKTVLPLAGLCDVEGMVGELDNYLALAQGSKFPRDEVDVYTEKILWWWESHEKELPCLAKAAMIMFAFTVNSAGCERVFSLLKSMFGPQQAGALADYIQAALMLRYNKRLVHQLTEAEDFNDD